MWECRFWNKSTTCTQRWGVRMSHKGNSSYGLVESTNTARCFWLWGKHIFITTVILTTVDSRRIFVTLALRKPIPTVPTWVTSAHIVSTHVSNLLFKEILAFIITCCVEMIKLCGRQVGNCRLWYCTRTSIDMGRCKVCVPGTITPLVETI